jgi:hypothetical protein
MEGTHDYFLCDSCQNRDFKRVCNFSIRFYGVNFSDERIYEKLVDELYQCTKCNKVFTVEQIEERLDAFKRRRKGGG